MSVVAQRIAMNAALRPFDIVSACNVRCFIGTSVSPLYLGEVGYEVLDLLRIDLEVLFYLRTS